MSSVRVIEKQCSAFLKSGEPEVVVIKGKWGIGKTFTWEEIYKKNKKQAKLDKYVYVSLFGINLLDELKLKLLFQKDEKKNIKKTLINMVRYVKGYSKSIDMALGVIGFVEAKKKIICLDDFERATLDAGQVFSLISNLKEQNKCQVVLIMNDKELDDEKEEGYKAFRDKVVDKEFAFERTAEECADIVFAANDVKNKLKEKCVQLGIDNIRILQRVKRLSQELVQIFIECSPNTEFSALSSLVLFTYIFYSNDKKFPELDYFKRKNESYLLEDLLDVSNYVEEAQEREQEKKYRERLLNYGYAYTDELDIEIACGVERGYFDADIIRNILPQVLDRDKKDKVGQDFHDIWSRRWHNTFDNNGDVFVKEMCLFIREHITHLSLESISGYINVLSDLKYEGKVDELIDFIISQRGDDLEFIQPNRHSVFPLHQKLRQRLDEVYQSKTRKTLLEVIKGVAADKGMEEQDRQVFAKADSEEFYRAFMSGELERLTNVVRKCLELGDRHENKAEIEAALKKIARKDATNKVRIKTLFGIDINEDS